MKSHPGGSHGNEAIPDQKMGHGMRRSRTKGRAFPLTSNQNRILKKVAGRKRRQRDKY